MSALEDGTETAIDLPDAIGGHAAIPSFVVNDGIETVDDILTDLEIGFTALCANGWRFCPVTSAQWPAHFPFPFYAAMQMPMRCHLPAPRSPW